MKENIAFISTVISAIAALISIFKAIETKKNLNECTKIKNDIVNQNNNSNFGNGNQTIVGGNINGTK